MHFQGFLPKSAEGFRNPQELTLDRSFPHVFLMMSQAGQFNPTLQYRCVNGCSTSWEGREVMLIKPIELGLPLRSL